MLKILLVATVFILLLFTGCTKEAEKRECAADKDCVLAGCSGQVCTTNEKAAGVITTCEWKEEYNCYKLTACGCVEGSCEWKETADFLACRSK